MFGGQINEELAKELFTNVMDACEKGNVDPSKIIDEMRHLVEYMKETRKLSAMEGLIVVTNIAHTLYKVKPEHI